MPSTPLESFVLFNTLLQSVTLPQLQYGYSSGFGIENNSLLQTINAKNGSNDAYSNETNTPLVVFLNNPMLQSICVDALSYYDGSIQQTVTEGDYWANSVNDLNVVITTYCNFTPGGQYNTITGIIFYDCVGSNSPSPNVPITISQGEQSGMTFGNSSGNFIAYASPGSITIAPQLPNPGYFTLAPLNFTYNFTATGETVNTNFCIAPNGVHSDLEINLLPLIPAVPGFYPTYSLVLTNNGNQTASGTMTMSFDDNVMDFTSSTPAVTSQVGNVLSWNYNNLMPFESVLTFITLHLNSPIDIPPVDGGDVLNFIASVSNVGDETPGNNNVVLNQIVVNSFDPNDKTCLEGNVVGSEMIGEYVHYIIRFENTGTFAAQNIVVKDMIDTSKFDVSTLIPISGSHPFETRISSTNKIEFIFENINLPFNDGYVAFKIKTKPSLVIGDTFSNAASIYFDYNFPIVTNTATTTIQLLGTPDFEFSKHFRLFPNPATNVFSIHAINGVEVKSISIYNVLGQLIQTQVGDASAIDVSNLKTGNYFVKIHSDKGTAVTKIIKQ